MSNENGMGEVGHHLFHGIYMEEPTKTTQNFSQDMRCLLATILTYTSLQPAYEAVLFLSF
jgi:hypothetical protein